MAGRGQIYFEWRRPVAGGEEHRPSFIKGFDGEVNPARPVLERICRELRRLGPRLASAETKSPIAILFDFANEWAQGYGGVGDPHPRYSGEAQSFYAGLKTLGQNIDVVAVSAAFDRYRVIVAPNLRLIDDTTADRLRAFVVGGGTLVLNYRAATQNMDNSMRRTLAPGVFAQIAGVKSEAILDLFEYNSAAGNLDAGLEGALGIEFRGVGQVFKPRTVIEQLTLRGAEPVATVRGEGGLNGRAAVTRNRHGKGWVFYAGCDSTADGFYESIARLVGEAASIHPLIAAPYGVEVTSREDAGATYYFLLNLTETGHEKIELPRPMEDLVGGRRGVTEVALGPLDAAVLGVEKE